MGFSPRPSARSMVDGDLAAEASHEFGAGAVCHLPHGLEAGTAEGMRDMRIEQQRVDGKGCDHRGFFAGGCNRAVAFPRQRPCRHGGSGQANAHGEFLFLERGPQRIEHGPLAAEEMRGAGHIEQQHVGRFEGYERREAVAPGGDLFEQPQIRGLVGHGDGDLRHHRTRIGQRHAAREAQRFRLRTDGRKPQRVRFFRGDDER